MGFFQQALQLVLHPYMQTGHLQLAASYRAPQTLFRIWHEAQDEFLRYQPFHQSLGIRKIPLPSSPPTIG
jgi:hypothetical protein